METAELLKPVARRLKKEWLTLNMEKVAASKHEYGIALKSRFTSFNDEEITLSALLTPGIHPQQNLNLVLDAALPKGESLEAFLPALSAFMQHATAMLSPMTVLVDMRTNQVVLRQSQIISSNYPIVTEPFYNALQVLIPLLQKTIESIRQTNPSQAHARKMAELLSESFYGAFSE